MKIGKIIGATLIFTGLCSAQTADEAPPSGFISLATADARYPRLAKDANREPMIAWLSNAGVFMCRWERESGTWSTATQIATETVAVHTGYDIPISFIADAASQIFAVAWESNNAGIKLSVSRDNGATWQKSLIASGNVHSPVVALVGGVPVTAWFEAGTGIHLGSSVIPDSSGANPQISLATDQGGNTLIAWSDATSVRAWTLASGSVTVAATSAGNTFVAANSTVGQWRIAFSTASGVYFSSSAIGNSWSSVLAVPGDGDEISSGALAMVSGSGNAAFIVSEQMGGDIGGVQCGAPKIAKTSDLINWTTCGPAPLFEPSFAARTPDVILGPSGEVVTAFSNPFSDGDLPQGVLLWRQSTSNTTLIPVSGPSVRSLASSQSALAPGSLATIIGQGLSAVSAKAVSMPLPQALGSTTISVGGIRAPLIAVSPTQLIFQIPVGIEPGWTKVTVSVNGSISLPSDVQIIPAAPDLFVYSENHAIAQNDDEMLNSAAAPAKAGSALVLYLTGLPQDQQVTASIDGAPATILYSGPVAKMAGLEQINLVVPAVATGYHSVQLSCGGFTGSPAMVNVSQ